MFTCYKKEVFEACTNKTVFTGFGAFPAKAPRPGAQSLIEKSFHPNIIRDDLKSRGIDFGVLKFKHSSSRNILGES
jgi:hypothetical protein